MSAIDPFDDGSQAGEVSYLGHLMDESFPKYLVDVGAHDGRSLSNSYPFIQAGWHGLLVEPLPKVFESLTKTHSGNPNIRCINKACSNTTGTLPLYVGYDGDMGMLSTLCEDDTPWFRTVRTTHVLPVEVDTLTNMLTAYKFPQDFSLLLIDAEGMDYEVLLGLDLNRFQPRIIVTEQYLQNRAKHNARFHLLIDNGYVLCNLIGCNYIFIKKDFFK